jgi:hypothetical protein
MNGAPSPARCRRTSLEEESVGELPCLRAQRANRKCLLKRLSNIRFVPLLDPDQHERRISCLEGTLRGFHDWAIKAVTVRERSCRRERDKSEPYCHHSAEKCW